MELIHEYLSVERLLLLNVENNQDFQFIPRVTCV